MKQKTINKDNGGANGTYLIFKRAFDIILTLAAMPIAILLIIIFGILIKLQSHGPIFYCQERVGKNGKTFIIYKLRSMHIDSEKDGPQFAQQNDLRVTVIGRFIRNTRIDEVPQIFNILKGDMSIVGPRPERPYFVNEFTKSNPNFTDRLKVRPGLTGFAQVNGGYEISIEEKLEKDLYYIKHRSLMLDLKIIIKTFKVAFGQIDSR